MRALRYSFDEALASLWRGRQSAALSTATIALAMLVLGALLAVTMNMDQLADQWSRSAEISVYLADEITGAEREAIEHALEPGPTVAARHYVSKADALERFRRTFSDLSDAVAGVGENPLPASYDVRLAGGAGMTAGVEALSAKLRQMPGVEEVRYDRQWLERLEAVVRIVRVAGFFVALVLTLAAAFTVATVVKLALYARRDEIEIMQLVGAPQSFIRGPFVMEGVLQGGIGAVAALAALGVAFLLMRTRYLVPLASAINVTSVRFLPPALSVLLVAGGMAVGCLGGLVAAWTRR